MGDEPPLDITTSDIYEWLPGKYWILHTAYGRLGNTDVGGVEIIGYDRETGKYVCTFMTVAAILPNMESLSAVTPSPGRARSPAVPPRLPKKGKSRPLTTSGWMKMAGGYFRWR
jgi:hypothetical protein